MKYEYTLLGGHKVIAFNDYYEAKKHAEKHNLILAEYGDCYGSDISYAFWNKSGNRMDDEDIIAYYTFKNTKPAPLSEEAFLNYML